MLSLETSQRPHGPPTPHRTPCLASKTNQLFLPQGGCAEGPPSPLPGAAPPSPPTPRPMAPPWGAPPAASAFGDPRTKDFGIKFLNLECEFLRREMCSECGRLSGGPHAETALGGTPLPPPPFPLPTRLGNWARRQLAPLPRGGVFPSRPRHAPAQPTLSRADPLQAGLCPAAQTKPCGWGGGGGVPPTMTPRPNLVPTQNPAPPTLTLANRR